MLVQTKTKVDSYKDLIVWQKAMDLVIDIYNLTAKYPKSELYTLTSQTRKSAVSMPSNIAEGRSRGSRKDYIRFLIIAYGSGAELETQLEISRRLKFVSEKDIEKVNNLLIEILKMLNKTIKTLKANT
jgi:four helix bundle protein